MVREVNSGDANWEIRAYTGKLSSSENSLGDELNKGILFSVKNQETGEVRVHKIKVRTRKDLEKPANEVDDVANKVAKIAEEFISEAIGALGVSGLTNLGSDVQGLILNFKEQDDGSLRLSREIGLQYQKSDGSLEKGEASKAKKLEVPSFTSAAAKTYRAALDMGLAEQSKLVALVGSLKIADFPRGSDVGQLLKQKIIDAGIESIGDRDPIDFLTTHEDLSGHQEELSNFLTNLFDEHYPSLSENQYKGKASALTKDFPLAKADLLCSLAKRLTGEQLKSRKNDLLTYAAGISLHKEVSPDLAEEADTLLAKLKRAISRTLEDGEETDSLISSKLGSVKDVLKMNIDADDEDEEGDKVDEGPDLELRFKVEGEDDHGDEESIDVEVGALRKMGIAPQLADQIVPDAELLKGVKSLSSNLQTTAKDTLTKLLVGASSYAEKEKILLAASMIMHHKLNSLSGENPEEVSKCAELATLIKDQYVQLESKEPINKDSSFIVSALLIARYETSPLEEEVKEALQSLTDFTSVGQLPSEEQDEYIYIISQAYLNSLKDNETSLEKNKIVFQGLMPDLSKDGGPKEWRVKSARQMDRAFQDFLGDMSLLVSGKEHKQINPEIHQKLPLNEVLIKKFISEAREWRTLDDETAAEGKTAAERIAKHTKELQYRLEDDSPYSCLGSKVDSIDSELSGVYDGERAVLNSDSPLGFTIEERSSALGAEELDGDVVAEGYQASVCHWQGFRPNQEDAHILNEIEVEIADKSLKIPVFGVLDGHGGAACSQYVRENLPRILKEKLEQFSKGKFPLSEEAIYNALKIAFVELDAEYKGRDGTTAVVSIVIGDKLYTANAGDSRAVLSREEGEDSYHIYELSKDQDSAFSEGSYESFEESSVVKRGGTFSSGRIGGNLKLGRAIGDPGVHVSARPKISCRTIQPGDTLTFACDGLWDSTAAPSEDPTKFSSREIGAFAASIDPTKAAKKLTQLGVKLERERFESDKAGDNISVLVVRVPANVKASEEKHDEGDEEASVDISVLLEQAKNFIPEGEELSLELVEGSADLLQKVANGLTDDSIPLEDKSALLGALDSAIVSSSEEVYSALIEKIEAMDTNKGALFEALAVIATETGETDLVLERAVGLFQRSVDAGVDLHPENKGRFLMSIESLPKGVLDKDPSKKERIKAFVTELAKEGDDFAIEVYSSIKLSEIEDVSAITYDTLELWEGISDSMKARVYCSLALKILTPSTNKEIGYDYFPKTTDLADKQSSFNKLVSTLEELNEKQLLSYTHPIILVRLKSNFTKLGSHLKLTSQELPDKTEALDPLFFASLKRCLTFFKNGSYELAPYFLEAKNLKSIEAEVMQGFYQELFQAIGELDQADVSLPKEIVGESWIDFSYNIAGSHTEPALEALRSMLDEGNIFAADILAEYLYYEPTKPDAVLQEIAKIIVNSKVKGETKETLLEETRKTFFSTDPEGFEEAFAKLDSLTENKGDLAKALVTGGIEGDRLSIARVFQVAIKQKLELTPEEKGFYSEVCGTALDTVLESESKHYIDLGIHIEEGKFDRLGIAILDSIDRNRHAKNQKQIRHLLSLLNLHKLEGDSTFNVLEGIYALEDGALEGNKEKELSRTLAQFFANFGMVEEQSSQQLMWSLSFCSKIDIAEATADEQAICRAALVEILSKDGYEFTKRDKEVIVKLYGILSDLGFDEGFDAFGDKVEGFREELDLAHDSFDLDGFLKKENHFLEQKSLADEEGVIYEEYLPAATAISSFQAGSLLKEIGDALTLCETPDTILEHFLGRIPIDGGSKIHGALRDAISKLEGVDKDFKDQLSIKLYEFFSRKYTREITADESNSKGTKWALLEVKYLMGVDSKNLSEDDAEIYHNKLMLCLDSFVGEESFTLSHQEIFDCLLKLHQPISGEDASALSGRIELKNVLKVLLDYKDDLSSAKMEENKAGVLALFKGETEELKTALEEKRGNPLAQELLEELGAEDSAFETLLSKDNPFKENAVFNVAAIKSEASKGVLRDLAVFIEQSIDESEINALLACFFEGISVDDTEVHQALKEALVEAMADWDVEGLDAHDKDQLIIKIANFFHEVYLSDVNSQDYDEETKKEEIGKLSLLTVGYYEKVSPENLSDENRLLYIASMIAVPLTDDFEARKDVSASDFLNKSLSLARECGPDGKMGAAVLIAAWYNSLKTKLTSLKSNDAGNLKNIKFLAKEAINSSKEKIKSRAVFASFFGGGLDKRQKMKMNTYIISSYLLLIESEFDVSKSKCSELREFLKNDGVLVDGDEEEINDEDIFLEEVYASLVKRELYSSFEEVFQDNPALTISKFLDGEEAYINKLKDGAWKELDPVFIVSLRKELLEALEGIDEDALPISEEQFLSEWNKAIPPGELLAVFEKTCLSEASPDPFESWKKLCISAGFIREYSSDEEIFDLLGQAGSLGLKTIEPLVKGGFELFSLDESRLDKYTEALLRAPEESIPDLESYLEGLGLTNSRWFKSSLRRVQVSFTEKLAEGSNPELLAVKSKVDALLEKGSADKEFTLEGFIQENLPASEGEADKKFLLRLSSALDKVAGERVNKLLVYFLGEITLDNKDAHNALRAAIASIEDEAVRDKLSSKIGAFFKKHYRKVVVEDGGDRRKIKEIKALYNHYYHSISVANLSSSDLFSYYNDLMNTKLDALEAEGIAPQEIYDRLFSILEYLESPGAPKVLGLSPKVRKLELLSWCKLNEAKFTEEKRAENILKVNINDELAEPGAIMHLGTITLIKNLYSLDSSLFDKDTLSEFLKRELRAEKEAKAVLSGQEIEEQKKRIAMIETVLAEVEKVEGDA